ncbi:uncharacterized protein [Spinacia oleracea]|uniref:Reverse transcriptase zinc-binding domain-containing protein n=1 Tax=Spinacia oleracea TaxID=3562 RepID=A0A9R0IMB7_SPIOL|nr:uncharacterized protein LOC110790684 [Spinacia oleracea]
MWLASQDRLKTKSRLLKVGIGLDSNCAICDTSEETVSHLFFDCNYSKECRNLILLWLGLPCYNGDLNKLLKWARKQGSSKFTRQTIYTACAGLVYHVWKARNTAVWEASVPSVQHTVERIQKDTKGRIQQLLGKKVRNSELNWFHSL